MNWGCVCREHHPSAAVAGAAGALRTPAVRFELLPRQLSGTGAFEAPAVHFKPRKSGVCACVCACLVKADARSCLPAEQVRPAAGEEGTDSLGRSNDRNAARECQ